MSSRLARGVWAIPTALILAVSGCTGNAPDNGSGQTSTGRAQASGASAEQTKASPGLPTSSELAAARRDAEKVSVSDLAGQVIVGNYSGTDASGAAAMVRDHHLGGVVVMGDNVPRNERAQMPQVSTAVQDAMRVSGRNWPGIVATDQEGGPVARFSAPVTPLPAGMAYGAADDAETATAATEGEGQELRSLGINMVFAPDADVTVGAKDTTIGVRSPGEDPQRVSRAVNAEVAGFQKAGLVPVIKHFPGHGSVTTDTHESVATQNQSLSQLLKRDWVPFAGAVKAGVPAVMSAHIKVTAIDASVPGTLSAKVLTGQLRDNLGFKGLIVTDAMNMGAIANTYDAGGAASVSALNAGADVILMPRDVEVSRKAITDAVGSGKLSKERLLDAVAHIVATMRHEQVKQPSTTVVGTHTQAAKTLARKSITQLGGRCQSAMVGKTVNLVGGSSQDRARMSAALSTHGIRVGGQGTEVSLISPGVYNAGKASAEGGSAADSSGGGGGTGGTAGVQIALDVPYALAQRPAGSIGLAAYGNTPATFAALADVLTGKASAEGTLPVQVGKDAVGASSCAK